MEDGAAGKPASMTSELDQDQKDAIAWIIALPTGDDASPKLDQNLRSGPFPVMWTRDSMVMNGIQTHHGVVTVVMFYFLTEKLSGTSESNRMVKVFSLNHLQKMRMKIQNLN